MPTYWHPTRPYDLTTAILRAGVATGSTLRAATHAHSPFNGHRILVDHSTWRGWAASYIWSGTHWLARRCSFIEALDAAEREHAKGALGSEVVVECLTEEEAEICRARGMVPFPGYEARNALVAAFVGPLHERIHEAIREGRVDLLLSCSSVEEYDAIRRRG